MTLLVVSDVHGRSGRLNSMLEAQIGRPEAVLFLGDGIADVSRCDGGDIPFICVRGNCDVWSLLGMEQAPESRMLDMGGFRIFMTHGHGYIDRGGVDAAAAAAAARGADALLFGHTHVKYYHRYSRGETVGGAVLEKPLHVFNPGSLGSPRDGGDPSFGVVELRRGEPLFSWGSV